METELLSLCAGEDFWTFLCSGWWPWRWDWSGWGRTATTSCSLDLIPAPPGYHRTQARGFPASWGCAARELQWGSLPFTPPLADLSSSAFSRVRVRYQKRQKLQFETKLGMNSPF